VTGRDRLVGIVVLAGLLLGGFWFLILAPKRKEATELTAKVALEQQRLVEARASATSAVDAKERYAGDYAAVAALGQAVPQDDDVPSLIVQVNRAADKEKVDFRSLTLDASGTPAAAPAAPAATPAAPAASNGGDSGSSGNSADAQPATPASGTAPATPAATPAAAPATSTVASSLPPGAAVGTAGFPTMPFSFEFVGSFFRLEDFFNRVSGFTSVTPAGNLVVRGRLLSVDSFDLKAAPAGFPKVAASVKATAYVLPLGQGLTAGATASGPSAGGAPADSSTPSSGGASPATAAAASIVTGGR
jgi:hypothetical protein